MPSNYSFRGTANMSQHDRALNKSASEVYKYQRKVQETNRQLAQLNRTVDNTANSFNNIIGSFRGGNLSSFVDSIRGMRSGFADASESAGALGLSISNVATSVGTAAAAIAAIQIGDAAISKMIELTNESVELAIQAEGIRNAFQKLGDESLLDGLREATHGTVNDLELMKQVVKANDFKIPLEDLARYLEFAQLKSQQTGESVDYLVNSIVTGLGRQSIQILDNLGLSAAELKSKMEEGKTMTEAVAEVIDSQLSSAGEHFETTADRMQRRLVDLQNEQLELGDSLLPLKDTYDELEATGTEALLNITQEVIKLIGNSDDLNTAVLNIKDAIDSTVSVVKGSIEYTKTAVNWCSKFLVALTPVINMLKTARDLYNGITGNKNEMKSVRMDNSQEIANKNRLEAEMANIIASRNVKPTKPKNTKTISNRSSGRSSGRTNRVTTPKVEEIVPKGSLKDFNNQISDLKKNQEKATNPEDWKKYQDEIDRLTFKTKVLKGEVADPTKIQISTKPINTINEDFDKIKEGLEKNTKPINIPIKVDAKETENGLNDAAEAIGQFSAAFAQMGKEINVPELNIAGTIAQAVANVALGYGKAASAKDTTSSGWAWLAFAAVGLSELMTTIATIKSATAGSYASGGIIGGSTTIGDYNLARVNKGEMILNGSQQAHLFNAINNNRIGGEAQPSTITWRIQGSDLYGALKNYGKSQSKLGKNIGVK